MTSEVKKLFRQCHRLHKRQKRTQTLKNIETFRNKRREAKTAWANAKTKYYNTLASKLYNPDNTKHYWKLIRDLLGNKENRSIPYLLENDSLVDSSALVAKTFNEFFSSQQTVANDNDPLPILNPLTLSTLSQIRTHPEEVETIIAKLKINKANGPDGISNRLLKETKSAISYPISQVINKSFDTCTVPTIWKLANVVPVHKKEDKLKKETVDQYPY
jgi:hypothetical protein